METCMRRKTYRDLFNVHRCPSYWTIEFLDTLEDLNPSLVIDPLYGENSDYPPMAYTCPLLMIMDWLDEGIELGIVTSEERGIIAGHLKLFLRQTQTE